ncbi:MAG TPA: SDR family oxidoreductase [Gemmatimonadaceae bacterium]|nr:SDR family oxidoreductase [Gemmatimonadaceae bacterium]
MLSLITGVGSRGQVGETVAGALARRGDTVLVVSRSEDEVRARAAELVAAGYDAHGYACDLADAHGVSQLATRARQHGERLDALVNLAGGFGVTGPIADSDPATFDRMFRINLTTAYLATRALYPLVRTAGGSIVFFASEAVLDGQPARNTAAYVAAKSAVVALMRSVADEGREHGVRANALAPSAIRTATNEASMARDTHYVEREEVASVVAFLCSPAAVAITGQVIRLRR